MTASTLCMLIMLLPASLYIYIYIYIYRERETDRERDEKVMKEIKRHCTDSPERIIEWSAG